MVHNFDEIIMIQRRWRHNEGRAIHSPFVRLASYPPQTVAALIALLFVIFSAIVATSIVTSHLIFGIGLALAFGFQLAGHVVEFIRMRRYMPHIVTALITLPYYPWLFHESLNAGCNVGELTLATGGMLLVGLVILRASHAASGRFSRWISA
jgi:hypothetical protein